MALRQVRLSRLKRRGGVIINITSASGHYGGASSGGSAYDASKGGLRQLTYALAAEFGPHHIRVNAIAPGVIVTERPGGQALVEAEVTAHAIARTPLRRLGLPQDVGKAAVFLACGDDHRISMGQPSFSMVELWRCGETLLALHANLALVRLSQP